MTYIRKMLSTKDDSRRPIPTNIPPRVVTALQPTFLHRKLLRGENTKVRPNEIEATHAVEKKMWTISTYYMFMGDLKPKLCKPDLSGRGA